jgi:hypothetical protein
MKVGGLKSWRELPVCIICRDHCVKGGDRGAGYVECRPLGYGAALCVSRSRVRNISTARGDTQEKCAQPCVRPSLQTHLHGCQTNAHKAFCKRPFILFRMTRTFEFWKPICQSQTFWKNDDSAYKIGIAMPSRTRELCAKSTGKDVAKSDCHCFM